MPILELRGFDQEEGELGGVRIERQQYRRGEPPIKGKRKEMEILSFTIWALRKYSGLTQLGLGVVMWTRFRRNLSLARALRGRPDNLFHISALSASESNVSIFREYVRAGVGGVL